MSVVITIKFASLLSDIKVRSHMTAERIKDPEEKYDRKLNQPGHSRLIFCNEKWYIIEINPRLSGMTTTYAVAAGMNFYEYIFKAVTEGIKDLQLQPVCNKKIPLQSEEELKTLSEDSNILFISQIQNETAKQEREKGFCEIIVRGAF